MKRISVSVFAAIAINVIVAPSVLAMCIWFVPPERRFEPARNIQTLIIREQNNDGSGDTQLIVQPEFSGTATDFALVMPFPSEPEVDEAPSTIFTDLEDLTNPLQDFLTAEPFFLEEAGGLSSADARVEVIEQRDVGDYTATTLKADDSQALLDWLQDNGYEVPSEKQSTIDAYVSSGSYFVALKVNLAEVTTDADGELNGTLNPIVFSFESSGVMLPLRLMAGDDANSTLTIYTAADDLLYVPGASIQFNRKVTSSDIAANESFESYDLQSKWLARNQIVLRPDAVTADVELLFDTSGDFVIQQFEPSIILNPDLLPAETGLVVSDEGVTRYSDQTQPSSGSTGGGKLSADSDSNYETSLWVAVGLLAAMNAVLLALLLRAQNAQTKQNKGGSDER